MKNLFIEYPKCSTCQKAKKWLDENKIEYVDRNIVTETPTKEELKKWITKSGLDVRKFFNTSGMKYRELNIKEKIKDMSEDEIVEFCQFDWLKECTENLVKKELPEYYKKAFDILIEEDFDVENMNECWYH